MAGVPRYDNFEVAPTAPGGNTFTSPDTSAMGESGRQLVRLGTTMEQAGKKFSEIVQREQEQANDLRVIEAENAAREAAIRLTIDERDGYFNVKGGDVMSRESGKPLADEYRERFDTELAGISGRLSNEAQREAFQRSAMVLSQSFYAKAKEHEGSEYRGYQESVLKGAEALAAQEIGLHYTDIAMIDQRLGTLDTAVAKRGKTHGMAGDEILALQAKARSGALFGAMAAAFDADDLTTAQMLFDKYKDSLLAEDRGKIEGPLRREIAGKTALSAVSEVLSGAIETDELAPGEPDAPPGGTTEQEGKPIAYRFPLETKGVTVKGGEYGASRDGGTRRHGGRDYAKPNGTPVIAPGDGEVVKVWHTSKGGLQMQVRLADGSIHGFAHLSRASFKPGQRIRMGQTVGAVGDGHLHYTVKVGGQNIDPESYRPGEGTRGATQAIASARRAPPVSRTEAWAQVKARLGDNPSLDLVKAARAEFDYQWTAMKQDRQEAEEGVLGEAFQALLKNGGNVNALPGSVKRAIPGDMWDSVLAFAGSVRSYNDYGKADRDEAEDKKRERRNDAMYNYALTNPQVLRDVSDTKFLQHYAGHPQFKEIATYRARLRGTVASGEKDKAGDLSYETINRTVDNRLQALGIDPKDKPEQVGAIRRFINGAIAGEQRRLGRPLNDVEIESFTDRQFAKTQTLHNYVLGFKTSSDDVPLFSFDVGQINRKVLKEIDQALDRAGQPRTDANRLMLFYRMRGAE